MVSESQRRANKAYRDGLIAKGYKRKAFVLSPLACRTLEALGRAHGTETKALEHLLAGTAAMPVQEAAPDLVPIQRLDVDAEYRLTGPVKPAGKSPDPQPKPVAQKAKEVAGNRPISSESSATAPIKVEVQYGPTPRAPGALAKKGKAK